MSRDKEFRARDKKVHKMTRDGLVEQNQTAGTEERISQRLADVSFDKARPAQETIGRSAGRKQPPPRSKQGAKPADFVERPPDTPPSQERFADTVLSADVEPQASALSMRGASDTPMLAPTPIAQSEVHASPHRGRHRGKGKRATGTKSTQHGTSYQAKFSKTEAPEFSESTELGADEISSAPHLPPERERLRFDSVESLEDVPRGKSSQHGTRYQGKFAPKNDTETLSENPLPEQPSRVAAPERGRLRFDKTDTHSEPGIDRTAAKKRQAAHFAADAAVPEGAGKLRYDKSELPPGERAADSSNTGSTTDAAGQSADAKGQASGTSRQQKKFDKAERKVRTTDEKLEKAKSKLPTKWTYVNTLDTKS